MRILFARSLPLTLIFCFMSCSDPSPPSHVDADAEVDGGDADIDTDAEDDADDAIEPDGEQPPSELDASIVEAVLPRRLDCGRIYNASVTVRNSGTETWTDELALSAVGGSDPLYSGDPQFGLPTGVHVEPGETESFRFVLTAPSTPGIYTTAWQMFREPEGGFGEVASRDVGVSCRDPIDATTLDHKHLYGYQGWFYCPGDGSPIDRWFHWFRGQAPTADSLTIDMWPDMSELGPSERFDTAMTLPDGSAAQVYSAWNSTTVERHFAWMEEHNLDGIMLQRFMVLVDDTTFREVIDQVARNARSGAEAHGRVFAMMYDITGHAGPDLVTDIQADWTHLVDDLGLTESDRYLHHNGRPFVAIWGFGFDDRPGTPSQATALIEWFQSSAPARLQATVMGGVPTHWRTLDGDSYTDPAWADVYRSWDVISPWAVGRYDNNSEADRFRREQIEPDMEEAIASGADYMPVVFPGFSWHNLLDGDLNQIPRRGGRFYWRQVYNALDAGNRMLYTAMFDEVDEGTAMYKLAPTDAELPVEGDFVPLDIDGEALPSDWYLRLADEASAALRGELPLTTERPIDPD